MYSDVSNVVNANAEYFMGNVDSFSHIYLAKRRYGAAAAHRGKNWQYAYIDNRVPVQIQRIYRIKHTRKSAEIIECGVAIIRRFRRGYDLPGVPWELR